MASLFSLGNLRAFAAVAPAAAPPAPTVVVRGKITDPTGAVIPGAAVTLTDLTTNKVLHTLSTANGQYVFHDVPVHPQMLSVVK